MWFTIYTAVDFTTEIYILLSATSTMAGRAKSNVDKANSQKHKHDTLMARAVKAYQLESKKPKKERDGLRKVCLKLEELGYSETGERIKLSHMTLKRLAAGGKTRKEANEDRTWLTPRDVDVVIDFVNEMAGRGFPLSHARLKEHVDLIASARLGNAFPISGVGVNWTYRFSQKHTDRIKISRSRALEDKRGRAANPHTNDAWWKLLGDVLKQYQIKPVNLYGEDEVGMQAQGQGEREYVFGPRTKAAPYQQRSGSRENITVLVTICADGTSIPPAVIFKGNAYNVKWGENNPLNAS
jgi:hypothetical protein